jgi:hypothetical protein
MRTYVLTIIVIVEVGLLANTVFFPTTRSVAAESPHSSVVFDSDDKMKLPTGYRAWVFVDPPLTQILAQFSNIHRFGSSNSRTREPHGS